MVVVVWGSGGCCWGSGCCSWGSGCWGRGVVVVVGVVVL